MENKWGFLVVSVYQCRYVRACGFGSNLVLGCRVSLLHFLSLCSAGCRKGPEEDVSCYTNQGFMMKGERVLMTPVIAGTTVQQRLSLTLESVDKKRVKNWRYIMSLLKFLGTDD